MAIAARNSIDEQAIHDNVIAMNHVSLSNTCISVGPTDCLNDKESFRTLETVCHCHNT